QNFDVIVRSEHTSDEGVSDLSGVLLINYGNFSKKDPEQPWEDAQDLSAVPLPDDGSIDLRRFSLTFSAPAISNDIVDCKRVTMVVSHSFLNLKSPYKFCPTQNDDAAQLTWFVALCGASVPSAECSFDNCAK